MNHAMIAALKISLCITAVWICTRDGMLLGAVRARLATMLDKWLGAQRSEFVQKPLWNCPCCMASLWTCVFAPFFEVEWIHIPLNILMVCGMCSIISYFIKDFDYANEN
jgi:hypothetical protein